MLAIALLGMAANVPLGIWREHTKKFSPQWFVAVHSAVPFVAMLRKSVLMPKTAMAFTIAASILGQTIGARAEKLRLNAKAEAAAVLRIEAKTLRYSEMNGHCGEETAQETLTHEKDEVCVAAVASAAGICY
ncbi:hypothetical protein HPP92_003431 [Vanilla planifolia]|uniref:Uncharacterized protein n=1 Tax=Vanilla planifolia TaxID=51239 RepID=A0A835RUE2_VANPL|nr:hypothetical protein HPP92_003431 [Vanilla planifolia]